MSSLTRTSIAVLLPILPAYALVSGEAPGVWRWRMTITRADEPAAYRIVIMVQLAIVVLFLLTGQSWTPR